MFLDLIKRMNATIYLYYLENAHTFCGEILKIFTELIIIYLDHYNITMINFFYE